MGIPQITQDELQELVEKGEATVEDGFYILEDGDCYDPYGYYFDKEGYDEYGGYYEHEEIEE